MDEDSARPALIVSSDAPPETRNQYPDSDERCGLRRRPGPRPHAEEKEEEFVYVLEGDEDHDRDLPASCRWEDAGQ